MHPADQGARLDGWELVRHERRVAHALRLAAIYQDVEGRPAPLLYAGCRELRPGLWRVVRDLRHRGLDVRVWHRL